MARPRLKRAPRDNALLAACDLLRAHFAGANDKTVVLGLLEQFAIYLVTKSCAEGNKELFRQLEQHCRSYTRSQLQRLHERGYGFARSQSMAAFFLSFIFEELALKISRNDGFFTSLVLSYHMAETLLNDGKQNDRWQKDEWQKADQPDAGLVLDLCCGSANLLVSSLDYLVFDLTDATGGDTTASGVTPIRVAQNLRGIEIDESTARLARCAVAVACGVMLEETSAIIVHGNALQAKGSADYIIANPPWTRPDNKRPGNKKLDSKRPDGSYIDFIDSALGMLKKGGRLAILTPAALYCEKNAENTRRTLLQNYNWQIEGFINEDQTFAIHTSFRFALSLLSDDFDSGTPIRVRFNSRVEKLSLAEKRPWINYERSMVAALSATCALIEVDDEPALSLVHKLSATGLPLHYFHPSGLPQEDRGRYRKFKTVIRADDKRPFTLRFGRDIDISLAAGRLLKVDRDFFPDADSSQFSMLPLLEGKQVEQFALRGEPSRYLFNAVSESYGGSRVGFASISSATNTRSMKATVLPALPCSNSLPFLTITSTGDKQTDNARRWCHALTAIFNSLTFDYALRARLTGTNLNYFILDQCPLPALFQYLEKVEDNASLEIIVILAEQLSTRKLKSAKTVVLVRALIDALVARLYALDSGDFSTLLRGSLPGDAVTFDRGFHRVDAHLPVDVRLPNLAFHIFIALDSGALDLAQIFEIAQRISSRNIEEELAATLTPCLPSAVDKLLLQQFGESTLQFAKVGETCS
jgi:hypothetical protein